MLGDVSVDPIRGNVSFGSGKQAWAFTIPSFAKLFAGKVPNLDTFISRLWGEHYYDEETKKFYSEPFSPSKKPLTRYAVQIILDPLVKMFNACFNNDFTSLDALLPKVGLTLNAQERELRDGKLIRTVMGRWLPVADTLTRMIIEKLPSPKVAQKYRVENLYTGPKDDECARAIRECDPNGPLTIFISKMIDPKGDGKRFYAFGRIFSGTVKSQQEVRILAPNFVFGENHDLTVMKIPGTQLFFGPKLANVAEVPCGNTVSISGLEKVLSKSGTITTSSSGHPIAPMKFSVAPVVRTSIAPVSNSQLSKFTAALQRLEKVDPCLQVITKKDEFIIAGAGEFHIEVALNELRAILGDDVPIKTSPPIVEYNETVTAKSSVVCLAKSPNGHNRLFFTAEPLSEKLCKAIEQKTLEEKDQKVRAKQLCDEFDWDKNDAAKVWCWKGTNVVVDMSFGVSYLLEILPHVKSAFESICDEGVLCGEPLRGVRFNLHDAKLHADTIHRGPGQIIPAATQVFKAAMLAAKPAVVEPFFLAEIETDNKTVSAVYSTVNGSRGKVVEQIPKEGTPLTVVKAHLPVEKSFGFDKLLRANTSGHGFLQLMFSHWQNMPGDPTVSKTPANDTVMQVRKRKLMKEEIPKLEEFNDKL